MLLRKGLTNKHTQNTPCEDTQQLKWLGTDAAKQTENNADDMELDAEEEDPGGKQPKWPSYLGGTSPLNCRCT